MNGAQWITVTVPDHNDFHTDSMVSKRFIVLCINFSKIYRTEYSKTAINPITFIVVYHKAY